MNEQPASEPPTPNTLQHIHLTQRSHSASTDAPLPHHVIMTQMSGVGVDTDLFAPPPRHLLYISVFFCFIHCICSIN